MEIQGQRQLQIEDYIEIIFRRKWFIIIPFAASIIGVILALLFVPRSYKSTTMILVEHQKVPESYVTPTVTIDITERLNTITQQVMSRTRLESIINEFGLYKKEKDKVTDEELVELMRENIGLDIKSESKGGRDSMSAFSISYIGNDPETVMHVTNRLASLFIEENLKIREQQAEGTTEFLDTQMQSLKTTLEAHEAQIKLFKEKHMGELPSQLETNLRTLDRIQLERQITNDVLRSAEDRKIMIERQLSEIGAVPVNTQGITTGVISNNPQRMRLAALQGELTQLSSIYTDKYPDIIRLKNEISELESQIKMGKGRESESTNSGRIQFSTDNPLYATLSTQLIEVSAEVKNLKEKQKEIARNISILQGRVERIPEREQQMAALMRDYENTRVNYQSLLNKKLDAQLAESLEKRQKGEQFRILDPANLPMKPFKPDPKKIVLIGIALGIGCGAGLVFLLEYIDGSFRKPEDVYTAIGVPVLVSVPRIECR